MEANNASHLVQGKPQNTDSFLYTPYSNLRCPNNLHKWPELKPLKATLDALAAALTANDRSHAAFAYDCGHNSRFDGLPPKEWLAKTQKTSFRTKCETLVSCDHPGCITPEIDTIFKLEVELRPIQPVQCPLHFQSDHGVWRIRVAGFYCTNKWVAATGDDYVKLVLMGPHNI